MARKQQLLHELLNEEQEPFHLKTYIADRRSQLTKISPKNNLQIKKQKPIIDTSPTNIKRNSLCKNACLFTFQNSPGYGKSPFQSPCKSPNRAVFLRVPAKTAALLVEAAMRIRRKQSKRITNVGFGLFGSVLRRLKDRTKNKRRMPGVCDNEVKVSRKFEPKTDEKIDMDIRISCSCDTWSSSNEEKSMNLETSNYSSCSEGSANGDISSGEKRFISSPFRFSLQKSPSSSGHQTPEFSTPATSPSRHRKREKANRGTKNSKQVRRGGGGEEDEDEEKDRFSPVSMLDPPFEEDNGQESAVVDAGDYDLECSYANVIRAKQQLMYMLSRFEKLAELDPIELERQLLQVSDDDDQDERIDDEPLTMYREHSVDTFALEVISKSNLQKTRKISADTKRLVSDLIIEQKSEMNCSNNNVVIFDTSVVCVDTMIELSFKKELDRWTKFQEEEAEIAAEIEFGIVGLLVEELSEELCY